MMRNIQYLIGTITVALVFTACSHKRNPNEIVVKKPIVVRQTKTLKMGDYTQTRRVQWLGATYTITVRFAADTSLPIVSDGSQKYFDNRIALQIRREDGSTFFDRSFTKTDFEKYLEESYRKNGALLGIIFNRVEGDNLCFAASVGSPDKSSDEYVPLVLKLSRMGNVAISKDSQLDTGSDAAREGETAADDDI